MKKDRRQEKKGSIAGYLVGWVLCIVFGALFLCNLIIIVKGAVHPETPPSVAGITPMVVLSGSMSGDAKDHIEVGDLIFVGKADVEELRAGDVIAFMEPDSAVVVTHRITEVRTDENGQPEFITKGDANNTEDQTPVSADRVVGRYRFRLARVGDFALFLQTPPGMLVFIGIPLLAYIGYDVIRRQRYANEAKKKSEEMEAELQRLRALAGETQEQNKE